MGATSTIGHVGAAGSGLQTPPPDRRGHERVRLPMEVRWEGLSGGCNARLYDISLSGCYIESMGQTLVGERIRFEVQLPSRGWIQLQGEVVHTETYMGFGLRFKDLSEQQAQAVADLVGHARAASRSPFNKHSDLRAA